MINKLQGSVYMPLLKAQNDIHVIGIVTLESWFSECPKGHFPSVYRDFFVVGEWWDYHDGEKSNIEGKTTIAMCRDYEDAKTIFDRSILKLKKK